MNKTECIRDLIALKSHLKTEPYPVHGYIRVIDNCIAYMMDDKGATIELLKQAIRDLRGEF